MRTYLYTAICITLLFLSDSANATLYKAVQSGNYSDNSTWQGGLAPGYSLTDDVVEISAGVTVTLANNLSIGGNAGALLVDGTLSASSNSLYLSGVQFSGMGSISVDSFSGNFSGGFNFTGSLLANKMDGSTIVVSQNATITCITALHLTGKMEMSDGTLKVNRVYVHGTTGSIKPPSLVITNTGKIESASTTQGYNLYYVNGSAETGSELFTSETFLIDVDPGAGETVKLNGNLTLLTGLVISSGTFDMNKNDLMIMGDAQLSAGNGTFTTDSFTDIIVRANTRMVGAFRFHPQRNTVGTIDVDFTNFNQDISFATNVKVATSLVLTEGHMILQGTKMSLISGATIQGGSKESYIITKDSAQLIQDLDANITKFYPVGTEKAYSPYTIKGNSAHKPGQMTVNANEKVLSGGKTGFDFVTAGKPVVNRTWSVTTTASATDMEVTAQWSGVDESNSFNRSMCFISQHNGTYWDSVGSSAAANAGTNEYSQKRNFTSVGLFTVLDHTYTLSVEELNKENTFTLYPNPATNFLNIECTESSEATIYNISGQSVITTPLTKGDNTINIAALANGTYYIKCSNAKNAVVKTFIKR